MKEGSSLKDYLDALNSILMDLKNVELKIDDKDAALILLVSLPPSFDNFVNSFVIGKDAITLEDVRSSLHSRENDMGVYDEHKSETFEKFKHWKILIENQTGRKIKRLRIDNGLEFCSRDFNDFCKDEGISKHYTVRYTPQQNGVAERMNTTLLKRT
ncbi:retrovirus-related pol polyprotein from transposon TNT 1-94 [Tanacetum coccineum]